MADTEITELLLSWRAGHHEAGDELFSLVYTELKRLARRQLRRGAKRATLSTTELVHEAYLKLIDSTRVSVRDQAHFCALASRAMRQILVDHARRRLAQKRGHPVEQGPLDLEALAISGRSAEIVALDEAIDTLQGLNPRLSEVVELRFFGGLSVEEAARALDSSPRTVERDWQKARAFLRCELSSEPGLLGSHPPAGPSMRRRPSEGGRH